MARVAAAEGTAGGADDGWHRLPIRVYYEDTDAQGVVYYANYLRFMERGRTEWLRSHGVEQDRLQAEHGLCFSVVGTTVRFRSPARFNDELVVLTRLAARSRVRFELDQEVRRAGDGALLVEARCEAACLDVQAFRPKRLPQGLLPGDEGSATADE